MNRKYVGLTVWLLTLALMLQPVLVFAAEEAAADPDQTEQAVSAETDAAPAEEDPAQEAPVEEAPAQEEAPPEPVAAEGALEPMDSSIQPGLAGIDEKVSLDLRNIEVSEALRFLAQKGGLNMAISKSVAGRVQLLLNNVPIRDILDIILIANDLAYDKHGDVYNVMTGAEYKDRYGRKFSDIRKIKIFRLKYAVPDQAFALFEVLKSDIGRLLVDPDTGTVLVMDTQENIDRMQEALVGLELRKSIKVYDLKYAKALEVETRLKSQLDNKKVGFISADERTNQVIVETLPDRMKDIDSLILALDQKTREVLIDSKIIKVTFTNNFDATVNWEGMMSAVLENGATFFAANHPWSPVFRAGQTFVDNFTTIAPTANPTAGKKNVLTENLFLGHVKGNNSYELLINFLKTLGKTEVLSNPKLAVINNQEAKIHVGAKQAYVTTTTTTGSGGTTTNAEQVTFVDIGIQLSVTPTINEDGYVTMKIKPEISSVVDTLTTPSGNKIPIIDSSLAETTVMVKDGVSIIIGGLRKDEHVIENKRIPILGDLPIIGAPFNSKTDHVSHTELLILITPHVVGGDTLILGDRRAGDTSLRPAVDYRSSLPGPATAPLSYADYNNFEFLGNSRKEALKAPVRT